MEKFSKLLPIFIFFIFINSNIKADVPYYVDFKYILNQSEAGKKAQKSLKDKLENGLKKLTAKEKTLLSEEKKIIEQKKLIEPEAYKKKSRGTKI